MSDSANRNDRCMQAISAALAFVHKGEASEATAHLKQRFMSPSWILEASSYELRREGLNESESQLLSMIPELTRYAASREFGAHPKLTSLSIAAEYLKARFIGVSVEQFHVLCMDASGRLIQCALLQQGVVDETPFYLSKLLEAVITSNAQTVVLCHNHPGGTLRPSAYDVNCTLDALKALTSLQIPMLDHIIIAGDKFVSFRQLDHIPAELWLNQSPDGKLLRNWVDVEF